MRDEVMARWFRFGPQFIVTDFKVSRTDGRKLVIFIELELALRMEGRNGDDGGDEKNAFQLFSQSTTRSLRAK